MRTATKVLILLALTSCLGLSEYCGAITDNSGILPPEKIPLIQEQIAKAAEAGADLKVYITTISKDQNLDQVVWDKVVACNSWSVIANERVEMKSTLIVLALSPFNHRSYAILYGHSWDKALGDEFQHIKTDDMLPLFKQNNWPGGILSGMEHVTATLKAYESEAGHGTTVINQATDYSGLWKIVGWVLVILVAVFTIVALMDYFTRQKRRKENNKYLQQRAKEAKAKLSEELAALYSKEDDCRKSGDDDEASRLARVMREITDGISGISPIKLADPDVPGLPDAQYIFIRNTYQELFDKTKSAQCAASQPKSDPDEIYKEKLAQGQRRMSDEINKRVTRHLSFPVYPIIPMRGIPPARQVRLATLSRPLPLLSPSPSPVIQVNQDSVLTGAVMESMLSHNNTPTYSAPTPSYEPTRSTYGSSSDSSTSRSDSVFGGGSSDFGSSTDSSSMSGGSSDF